MVKTWRRLPAKTSSLANSIWCAIDKFLVEICGKMGLFLSFCAISRSIDTETAPQTGKYQYREMFLPASTRSVPLGIQFALLLLGRIPGDFNQN
jgi:hypothetical protein